MKYALQWAKSLPDTALYELFDRMVDAGHLNTTFYDGEITTHHEFRDMARRPDLHLWAVLGDGEPLMMFWLTDGCKGTFNIHFTTFTAPPICVLRGTRFFVATLLHRMNDENGKPVIEYLYGKTPACNTAACRWIKQVGFRPIGELPGAAWMADRKERSAGLISWASRDIIPEAWADYGSKA